MRPRTMTVMQAYNWSPWWLRIMILGVTLVRDGFLDARDLVRYGRK